MQFFLSIFTHKKTKPQGLIPCSPSSEIWYIAPETLYKVQQRIKPLSVRRDLIARAEIMFCGEIFRFLAAVMDWEEICDVKQKKRAAFKIIATFVESGSMFEINISTKTRNELIKLKIENHHVQSTAFEAAKLEITREVLHNPALKNLLRLSKGSNDSL